MADEPAEERQFTKAEAESRVGRRVKTMVPFSGIPVGTTGFIASAHRMNGRVDADYAVVIDWKLPEGSYGMQWGLAHEWFDRWEYEACLEELP